ncbi:MAG: hypothetical protein IKG58_01030 [Bacilli bacterium]|nr:hypothetical protein [Bacilli bacterium]MBR3049128.1 hypothetical protein [Bacilli bacterium]
MDHKNKLRYIDEINVELRTKIRKQRLENDIDKEIVSALKLLNTDKLDIKDKEKILETVELLLEEKELEEENLKIKEDINASLNNVDITKEKILIKRKKEDH